MIRKKTPASEEPSVRAAFSSTGVDPADASLAAITISGSATTADASTAATHVKTTLTPKAASTGPPVPRKRNR